MVRAGVLARSRTFITAGGKWSPSVIRLAHRRSSAQEPPYGEIAVSVGAEILKARRGGGAQSMSEILRPQYRYSLTKGDADI